MRPSNSRVWNSPTPYLFGGLALTLGLITLALIILACSYRKKSTNSSADEENQKPEKPEVSGGHLEPKILVVMAGDRNPTYLATPVDSSTTCSIKDDH
ncbi:Protein GLUTAMINE DUMPER like [Actinidia chinensis var. chinensis]|uniref:Protein GLUTAMINE DUMPER like n=1 Tax=Actinidia chinensis var. chinensis TaxID=1590841 RepID=A0A2R6P9V1_ACTCC|nr:Protein GLUTAMINE DUMPER like [Actinidia chinensis var. chinensis]